MEATENKRWRGAAALNQPIKGTCKQGDKVSYTLPRSTHCRTGHDTKGNFEQHEGLQDTKNQLLQGTTLGNQMGENG